MSTADTANRIVDEVLGGSKTASRNVDMLFGQVEHDTGAIRVAPGNSQKDTHLSKGMFRQHGNVFRYNIATHICYWWTPPPAVDKASAEMWLENHNYPVSGHRIMATGSRDMVAAHGWEY